MKEELESLGELSEVCSQIVLKSLYLARIGGPDISQQIGSCGQSRNRLSHCDRRLERLISHIHHIHDYRQYCYVGNTAQHCRLCFKTPALLVMLKIRNQPQEEPSVYLDVRTFVPVVWMCKKQTSVSHSSTESEIISLDAGLRMDGFLALDLCDTLFRYFHHTRLTRNLPSQLPATEA